MEKQKIVSRDEWLVARKAHLAREKELTHLRDQVSAERRALPWVKVDKPYMFEGPNGTQTLADLFGGRSQLIVYHFMFGPDWTEGCPSCSFLADHIDGANLHLPHHDVSLVAVARAPWPKLDAFKKRMGWRFKFVSSYGSDFNFDYHVSFTKDQLVKGPVDYNFETVKGDMRYASEELPGISVFYRNPAGEIVHTYSAYARGGDLLLGAYNYLDLTPKGRNEDEGMGWVRFHDKYGEDASKPESACHA